LEYTCIILVSKGRGSMKYLSKIILVFLLGSVGLSAQRIDTAWTRTFGGSGYEEGRSVQQTTDRGYIIVGYTESYGAGGRDVYLIKTDSLGDTLWTKTFGGSSNDEGYSVWQTDDGGYIVAGCTHSYGAGNADVYLIKTDSLGDTLWMKTYGGARWENGRSVQQTIDGGYIVAGETDSYGAGAYDVYLIKTDSLGDTLWTKTFGGSNFDWGNSVRQTNDGGYIVAVTSWDRPYPNNVYLIKTDILGKMLWTRASRRDSGHGSVQQTTDGGYIVAGGISSRFRDVYLIKTNPSGDTLWTKTFGGINYDCGYSVQQTDDEGYIVAGVTNSYGAGYDDVYLIKTDSLGNSLWTKTFGGSHDDYGYSVQQTNDGGYIVTGYTKSFGAGEADVYLIKVELFPGIIVTSPNGGEALKVDSAYDITWRSYQTSGGVKIEYSLNNGIDWTEIIASTPDDGSHPWNTPDTMSYNCLVRISDTNGSLSDTSDDVFTIYSEPFIKVTSPNGGEIWRRGSDHEITWMSAGTSGLVKIEYSINNGRDWTLIANRPADVGSYDWRLPSNRSSDSCLVRISDTNGTLSDISDSVFTIASITVTSPNGGEEWQADSIHDITWISYGTSGGVRIEYSLNNGSDWMEIIASTPDNGAYPWTIPDTLSYRCLILISDTNGWLSDRSDGVFTIFSVPIITLISPNGGEEWYNEDNHNIRWVSAGTSGEVKIEYSINNGRDWAEIIASTPDDGSYLWNPPDTVSDSCLVSISDTNGSISDISDSVFSLIPGSGVPIGSLEVYSLNVKAIATGSQVEFTYTLPEKANDIKFTLYNILGVKIKEENLKESPAGFYSGKINLNSVSKGIYFIRMEVKGGKFTQTKKFLLM
jgi:hypothetical protein